MVLAMTIVFGPEIGFTQTPPDPPSHTQAASLYTPNAMLDAQRWSAQHRVVSVAVYAGRQSALYSNKGDSGLAELRSLIEENLTLRGVPGRVFIEILENAKGVMMDAYIAGTGYKDDSTKESLFNIRALSGQFDQMARKYRAHPKVSGRKQ